MEKWVHMRSINTPQNVLFGSGGFSPAIHVTLSWRLYETGNMYRRTFRSLSFICEVNDLRYCQCQSDFEYNLICNFPLFRLKVSWTIHSKNTITSHTFLQLMTYYQRDASAGWPTGFDCQALPTKIHRDTLQDIFPMCKQWYVCLTILGGWQSDGINGPFQRSILNAIMGGAI